MLAVLALPPNQLSQAAPAPHALPTDAAALVGKFSGHIAVLPAPGLGDIGMSPVGRALKQARLAPHLALLTPAQFVDTNFFQARRFPLALYLGYESYYQTVQRAGDGDAALKQYLAGGGTLALLPIGPFPLYYNQSGKPVNGAASLGFHIGAGSFERPPPGRQLRFHAHTRLPIFNWPAAHFDFPGPFQADQRWRPSRSPAGNEQNYTALLTLQDDRGDNHGDGAALLKFPAPAQRSGRALYVWCSLLADAATRPGLVADLLRWALADQPDPTTTQLADNFNGRAQVTDDWTYWLRQAGQWTLDQGALAGRNCVADRFEVQGLARGTAAWRDYTLSVRFKIEQRGSDRRDGPWFGFRTRPDGDGYYLSFTARDCQLHKVIYGIRTRETDALARVPWRPDNRWHTLRVQLIANRLRAELDGQLLFAVKDDAHLRLPSMRHGGIVLAARRSSRSRGDTVVRFDDFQVQFPEK